MRLQLAKRVTKKSFQGDFVKMMLRAASAPHTISFAGGLPNPASFPVEGMQRAAKEVLGEDGVYALQYSTTAGYEPLRRFIAGRYQKAGSDVRAEDILITNGSQQALDIISAVLLDEGDAILLERPSYLSALQTFHLYDPEIYTVELKEDGVDAAQLKERLSAVRPKFFYAIPNFQNPTGLTYSEAVRKAAAQAIQKTDTLLIEDDPYGDLRFQGEMKPSFYTLLGEQCVMTGTFSKTVSPGMRIGWLAVRNEELRENMTAYKQVMDLHTNIFGQMVLSKYLETCDFDAHIEKIKQLYRHQAQVMLSAMKRYFPKDVAYTEPEGGMFIWVTLPEGMRAIELSGRAAKAGVAIAAGDPFYEADRDVRTFRLNYTNCDDATIARGIEILAGCMRDMRA